MYIFFGIYDWKKGRRKRCIFFINFIDELGLYMYFVLYVLYEYMIKGLYKG